jgi:hypothetical protein
MNDRSYAQQQEFEEFASKTYWRDAWPELGVAMALIVVLVGALMATGASEHYVALALTGGVVVIGAALALQPALGSPTEQRSKASGQKAHTSSAAKRRLLAGVLVLALVAQAARLAQIVLHGRMMDVVLFAVMMVGICWALKAWKGESCCELTTEART